MLIEMSETHRHCAPLFITQAQPPEPAPSNTEPCVEPVYTKPRPEIQSGANFKDLQGVGATVGLHQITADQDNLIPILYDAPALEDLERAQV